MRAKSSTSAHDLDAGGAGRAPPSSAALGVRQRHARATASARRSASHSAVVQVTRPAGRAPCRRLVARAAGVLVPQRHLRARRRSAPARPSARCGRGRTRRRAGRQKPADGDHLEPALRLIAASASPGPPAPASLEMIQKRITTVDSCHPSRSKWWWIGAIRKTRLPVSLNEVDLHDHRHGLQHEQPAHDHQHDLVLGRHRHGAERAAQSASEPVSPMKILAGGRVEPEEAR